MFSAGRVVKVLLVTLLLLVIAFLYQTDYVLIKPGTAEELRPLITVEGVTLMMPENYTWLRDPARANLYMPFTAYSIRMLNCGFGEASAAWPDEYWNVKSNDGRK